MSSPQSSVPSDLSDATANGLDWTRLDSLNMGMGTPSWTTPPSTPPQFTLGGTEASRISTSDSASSAS
ncbi:hypothetical protein M0804_009276 [Polistes exclamans]|nr:hypothetical protein M0804_009276 [Polistes exclamans]